MNEHRATARYVAEASIEELARTRRRFGQRPSKSADEAWAVELKRIWAMTPTERMMEALELDEETDELLEAIGRAPR